jgi:hypothetical protein
MLIIIKRNNAIMENCIQKKITAIEIIVYQKIKVRNLFLD